MSASRANILVISPIPFLPNDGGNRSRLHRVILALQGAGHNVHFLNVARMTGDEAGMKAVLGENRFRLVPYHRGKRAETPLQRFGRRLRQIVDRDARYLWKIDDWYDSRITPAVLEWHAERNFSVVVVEYVYLSRVLDELPGSVYKIIDTHDRFAMRHRLYIERGMQPGFFSTTPSEEARGLSRADLVLAIAEHEADAFRKAIDTPVVTIGHPVQVEDCLRPRRPDQPFALLIVGADNPINVDGLRAFLADDWPAIRTRIPEARLLVAGKLGQYAPASPAIANLGFVPEIADAYRQADVVINPVRTGTGLNIKSIEALGFGMPLVTTESGARGLRDGAATAFLQADDPTSTADAVASLWQDSEHARRLGAQALAYAEGYNRICVAELERAVAAALGRE